MPLEPVTRQLKAKDFVTSIQEGLTDGELIDRYKLTAKGLQSVLRQLLQHGLADRALVVPRLTAEFRFDDKGFVRKLDRKAILIPLRVCDAHDPKCEGIMTDVSINGIGVKGIAAKVGELKSFVVRSDEYFQIDAFSLSGSCRWATSGQNQDDWSAGFAITHIDDDARLKLQILIETFDYIFWR